RPHAAGYRLAAGEHPIGGLRGGAALRRDRAACAARPGGRTAQPARTRRKPPGRSGIAAAAERRARLALPAARRYTVPLTSRGNRAMAERPRKRYRFLSGSDDSAFCQRVSDALADGYVLYGDPVMVVHDGVRIVGQAVV